MSANAPSSVPKFCSECATPLNKDALFCHSCGAPVGRRSAVATGSTPALRWAVPVVAVFALLLLVAFEMGRSRATEPAAGAVPLGQMASPAPDISSLSPEERADRLFNRVMRLSSEGKADSAKFFASMAFGALEALEPLDAHRRYDMGLVALVSGDASRAKAQSDTILARRPTHLLGLSLAARAAEAQGDLAASRAFRRRLLAAEASERTQALPEYTDHDADVRAAIEKARRP